MRKLLSLTAAVVTAAMLALPRLTSAQIPPAISTPDKVETRLGTLEFRDGAPSTETVARIYDNLDFTHAFEAFLNTFQGVNMNAAHKRRLIRSTRRRRLEAYRAR